MRQTYHPFPAPHLPIPNISRTFPRWITSRGDPSFLSTHFVKSPNFTSCSTRTSATDTFTARPSDTPATHSCPRIAANPAPPPPHFAQENCQLRLPCEGC